MSVPERERGKFEKYSKCPFLKEMKEANLKNTQVSVPKRNERGKFEKYSKCPFLKDMKEANLKNTLSVRS